MISRKQIHNIKRNGNRKVSRQTTGACCTDINGKYIYYPSINLNFKQTSISYHVIHLIILHLMIYLMIYLMYEQSGPNNKQQSTTHGNANKGSGSYLRPKTHIQHTHPQHLSTSTQTSTNHKSTHRNRMG